MAFPVAGAVISALGGLAQSALNNRQQNVNNSNAWLTMKKQFDYNQQAANESDVRQRALMYDAPSLLKNGMKAAGMNTAGLDSSSLSGVSAPQTAGVNGEVPQSVAPIDVSALLNQSLQTDANMKVATASAAKSEAEAAGQNIDNLSKSALNEAQINKMVKDGLLSQEQADYLRTQNDYLQKTADTRIEREQLQTEITRQQKISAEKENEIKDIVKDMNSEQLKQLKFITDHQLERYKKELEEIDSRIQANKGSAAASFASAALAKKQALFVGVQTELEKAKVPYAGRLASAIADRADAEANIAWNNSLIQEPAVTKAKTDASYHRTVAGKFLDTIGNVIPSLVPIGDLVKVFK